MKQKPDRRLNKKQLQVTHDNFKEGCGEADWNRIRNENIGEL